MRLTEITIKLGSNSGNPNDSLTGFMTNFYKHTTPHPIDNRARLWGPVSIELSIFHGDIHLSDIRTFSGQNSGSGTKALEFLKSLADEHKVKISGTAKTYIDSPDYIQSTDRLLQWYEKNGFTIAVDTFGSADEGYEIEYQGK